MSAALIEVAEEALEQKLKEIKIEDKTIADEKTEIGKEKPARKPRISEEERRATWEKEQAAKKVVSTCVTGTVKWYSVLNRYGFIARDDVEEDIFVHQTAISKSTIEKYYLRTLVDGEKLQFDVVQGQKGLEAANVTGPDGAEVVGSKRFRLLLGRTARRRSDDPKKESNDEDNVADKKKRSSRKKAPKKTDDNEAADGGAKKERRTRRPRRFSRRSPRKEKGENENKADLDKSDAGDREEAATRRRLGSESPILTARCDSSLSNHDIALGAAAVDAQI